MQEHYSESDMDKINALIKMLFITSVFLLILESILPTDKFKAYLRLFAGAVILLTIVRIIPEVTVFSLSEQFSGVFADSILSESGTVKSSVGLFTAEKLKNIADNAVFSVTNKHNTVRIYESESGNYRIYISFEEELTNNEKAIISERIQKLSGIEEENIIYFVSNER